MFSIFGFVSFWFEQEFVVSGITLGLIRFLFEICLLRILAVGLLVVITLAAIWPIVGLLVVVVLVAGWFAVIPFGVVLLWLLLLVRFN